MSIQFKLFLVLLFFIFSKPSAYSQNIILKGKVTSVNSQPLEFVVVYEKGSNVSIQTDAKGEFSLNLPTQEIYIISFRLLGYKQLDKQIQNSGSEIELNVVMVPESKELGQVEVISNVERRTEPGLIQLDPKNAVVLPSAFGDFNKLLAVVPGVVANNELSSTYSVRGGNYDENLIYVNGIEVYRPFLISSGQQEGLSFINPNLARSVDFSTGAWQAKYGDKLSSILNVGYKEPKQFEASVQGGLLGGSIHLGLTDKKNRISFIGGFRNKTSRYLLNTLPTQGNYLPTFNDFQSYITIDLSNKKKEFAKGKRTTLGILTSFANNRYLVVPELSQTSFGTNSEILQLSVGFDGNEQMKYDTWQNGLKLSHWASEKFKTEFYASAFDTREREYVNLEAGYRLCNLEPDLGVSANQCAVLRGIGTIFNYKRNYLVGNVLGLENRSYYYINPKNTIEFGAKYTKEIFSDKIYEYSFIDSAEYVTSNPPLITLINLNTNRFNGYIQHQIKMDTFQILTYGVRLGYWDFNQELMISPSVQYSFKPKWKRDYIFRVGAGIYRQPPFYRELRDFNGKINDNIKAQSSFQTVFGSDYRFMMWGRPFKFTSELYGKYLWNVNPYDIDNVRIRYYANNNATAYAAGTDFRISGEFIKGEESWFSLGIMQAKERVEGSEQGWIRRPTDQRVTFAVFFQDHLPRFPSWKVFLSLIYGSGLPYGIPFNENQRNVLNIPAYRRVDVGFSKVIIANDKKVFKKKLFERLMIGVEVLNLFGINNTLSYIWISDFENRRYAIPQTLSQRFVNAKIIANF